MKLKFLKYKMKYSVGLIAIAVFISQVYYIYVFNPIKNKESAFKCDGLTIIETILVILKCLLAFLGGAMFSDMKFIKFGII